MNMQHTHASVVLGLLAFALLAPAQGLQDRVEVETEVLTVVPNGWHHMGQVPRARAQTTPLTMFVAIKHRNVDQASRYALSVSDPDNGAYGKHWSKSQVDELMAPAASSVEAVVDWLQSVGVAEKDIEHVASSSFLKINATVSMAEQITGAEYHFYTHKQTGRMALRMAPGTQYTVPRSVAQHLDFIAPTYRFPVVQRDRAVPPPSYKPPRVSSGTFLVTPQFIHELYQVNDYVGSPGDGTTQSVTSFIQQYYSPDDLQEFFDLLNKVSVGQKIVKQIGKNDPSNPGDEASLDVQYIMAVATHVDTWVWYTANQQTPFLDWLIEVANSTTLPDLFSVSYGEYENGLSKQYAGRVNEQFMRLALRGVSVLMASGDSGAGGNCTNSGRFSPDFPASSPWVTSVGGMIGGDAGKTPTGEVGDFISGGGFSDLFSIPDYQKDAVEYYLQNQKKLPDKKNWNQTGRGYPDLAAQSEDFIIVVDRIPLPGVGGTSCATPTTGAVFTLLNTVRRKAGKSALGFLNPFIYKTSASTANAFNDAVTGTNAGCDLFGFDAFKGWDPVTGLGSVNFRILRQAVEQLP